MEMMVMIQSTAEMDPIVSHTYEQYILKLDVYLFLGWVLSTKAKENLQRNAEIRQRDNNSSSRNL
jgi:hypothetical protein